jgi:hypothetical protein
MRATLDIDADILKAAKVLADAEHKTLGQVLSELVRKGLAEAADGLNGEVGPSREVEVSRCARDQNGAIKRRRPIDGS